MGGRHIALTLTVLVALVAMLALGATAAFADGHDNDYPPPPPAADDEVRPAPDEVERAPVAEERMPVTGVELSRLLLGAGVLLVAGTGTVLVARRRNRDHTPA
jgi:LPXTG-motif cell wall-anchored protein